MSVTVVREWVGSGDCRCVLGTNSLEGRLSLYNWLPWGRGRPISPVSEAATQTLVCYIYYVMQVYRAAPFSKSSGTAGKAARSGVDWLASVLNRPCKRSPRIP